MSTSEVARKTAESPCPALPGMGLAGIPTALGVLRCAEEIEEARPVSLPFEDEDGEPSPGRRLGDGSLTPH
jgi:hypothetical protein